MRFSLFLFLPGLLFSLVPSPTWAHFEREKKYLEEENKALREKIPRTEEATAKLPEYFGQLEEELVEAFKKDLQGKAQVKREHYEAEKGHINEGGQTIQNITQSYLEEQKKPNAKYKELVDHFQEHYYSQEESVKSTLLDLIRKSSASQDPDELTTFSLELISLYDREAEFFSDYKFKINLLIWEFEQTHQKYLQEIAPYGELLKKINVSPIGKPEEALKKMARMFEYAQKRVDIFGPQMKKTIDQIYLRRAQLIKREARETAREASMIEAKLNAANEFQNETGKMLDKKILLEDRRSIQGRLRYFEEYLQLQHEILGFEGICKDLKKLKEESSHFYRGCFSIHGDIAGARRFVDSTWTKALGLNATRLSKLDVEWMKEDLEKFKKAISEKDRTTAISINDSLLKKWDESVGTEAGTGRERSHE